MSTWSEHQLEPFGESSTRCTVCRQAWGKTPTSKCVGVPIFDGLWENAFPAAEKALGFKPLTKKQLDEAGYQTGKRLPSPCAALYFSKSDTGFLFLYNPAVAIPKRKPSAAQQAALAKAQAATYARYHCSRCGKGMEQHEYGKGECDRCKVILWAQQVLAAGAYILDGETTGLDTDEDEMVSLAILHTDGTVHFNSLIQPINPQAVYNPGRNDISAFDIHGISAERLLDAPLFANVYPQLRDLLTGQTVIVYHWDYDMPMLEAMCKRRGLPEIEVGRGWCAMEQYAQFVGQIRYERSRRGRGGWSYRYQRLPGGNHSALGDCQAVLRLLQSIASGSDDALYAEATFAGSAFTDSEEGSTEGISAAADAD